MQMPEPFNRGRHIVHGVISEKGRDNATALLPFVFFVLIAYSLLPYPTQRSEQSAPKCIAVLFFLALYIHISDRYIDICVLNAAYCIVG